MRYSEKNNTTREWLINTVGMKAEVVDKACQQLLSFFRNEQAFRGSVRMQGYMGSGNRKAEIMVISDVPTKTESATKMVGFSDYSIILTIMFNMLGIEFGEVYWTTAVKRDCERVNLGIIQKDHGMLKEEIISVNPSLIISLGTISITSLLNEKTKYDEVDDGVEYNVHNSLPGIPIISLDHPKNHILQDTCKNYFRETWNTIKLAFD